MQIIIILTILFNINIQKIKSNNYCYYIEFSDKTGYIIEK